MRYLLCLPMLAATVLLASCFNSAPDTPGETDTQSDPVESAADSAPSETPAPESKPAPAVIEDPLAAYGVEGADLQELKADGTPVLFAMAEQGDVEAVRAFLERGADVNIAPRKGGKNSVLHHLASRDAEPAVWQALIDAGADPNLANSQGDTPLHLAAQAGKAENARLLLGNGAHVELKNAQGKTALQLALAADAAEIAQLLAAPPKAQ